MGLCLDVAGGKQICLGKAFGKVEQNPSDFGQRATVDQQGRHIAFRLILRKLGVRCSFLAKEIELA